MVMGEEGGGLDRRGGGGVIASGCIRVDMQESNSACKNHGSTFEFQHRHEEKQ